MFRNGDKVRFSHPTVTGAFLIGLVIAAREIEGNRLYKIQTEDKTEYEVPAMDLKMETPAAPKALEGLTIRYNDGSLVPATIFRVNAPGTTVEVKTDNVRKRGDNLHCTPDPDGDCIVITKRHDGSWRVRGEDDGVATLGVRESAPATVAAK